MKKTKKYQVKLEMGQTENLFSENFPFLFKNQMMLLQ